MADPSTSATSMTSSSSSSSSSSSLRIGSRKSQLAMAQTMHVKALLTNAFPSVSFEVIGISTVGDKVLDVALSKIGEKSLFTKELEVALEKKEVDLVVHSLKDLPTQLPPGMTIGAILEREDPRDALVLHPKHKGLSLKTLPAGSVIGTSSLRRAAQLRAKFPDFKFIDIRGNLNTRLKKLDESGEFDGIILAVAGLVRLGWHDRISEILEKETSLYAVSQGALAVECREEDSQTIELLKTLVHNQTLLRCSTERGFMRKLEGGCSVPIGVHTTYDEETKILSIQGGVFSLDGLNSVTGSIQGKVSVPSEATELGARLAEDLMEKGAKEILEEIRKMSEKKS